MKKEMFKILTFVFANNSERTKSTQCSESLNEINVEAINLFKDHGYDGEEDDYEIEDVPAIFKVSLVDEVESHHDDFNYTLNNKTPCNDM